MWLKFLPIIFSGVCWVFLFGGGYYLGHSDAKQRYAYEEQQRSLEYQEKITTLVNQIRSQEIAMQSRINDIVSEQITKEETIKNEYEDIISNMRDERYAISNSLHVSKECAESDKSVSRVTTDTSDLICFSKADLYRKVEESMAIATECDRLVVRYNSLLEYIRAINDKQEKGENNGK